MLPQNRSMKLLLVVAAVLGVAQALDNGLALTPPMGWLSWERFRCNVDCKNDPDNCIGEKLYMAMADHMATDGYKELGYEYVNIDDCWMSMQRDAHGALVADPQRFPSGIAALAKYVHDKGLKLGIYEDFGTKTCGGYPGSEYFLEKDAQTFADWGVDMLKLDGCYSDPKQFDDAYPAMSFWLNQTGRPMLYSCSWPAYQEGHVKPNYPNIAKYCNIWRNYADIQDSWESLVGIINWFGDNKTNFTQVAAPGQFNDPDMLIIGDYGLSSDQQRTQMALWSIMASPLFMSVDLRNVKPEAKTLLQNKYAIAINQDPLGKQGRRVTKMGSIQVWTRDLVNGSVAFAFLNEGTGGMPQEVTINVTTLGLTNTAGYKVFEVFTNKPDAKTYKPGDVFKASVNPTGVYFGRAMPTAQSKKMNKGRKSMDSSLRYNGIRKGQRHQNQFDRL